MSPEVTIPLDYYKKLGDRLGRARDAAQLFDSIVNAPFHDKLLATNLALGIVVFLLENPKTNTVDRMALSDTYSAQGAVQASAKRFSEIKIPLDANDNIIVKAIKRDKPQQTDDWKLLFIPELTAEQARYNQVGAGIDCSFVFPVPMKNGRGAIIFSFFEPLQNISNSQKEFMHIYTSLVGEKLS